jgi:hypothetical protein
MATRLSESDLLEVGDILESFTKKLDKYSETDLIDLAARLKPIAKHCETIDEYAKEHVKEKLGKEAGTVKGKLFVAVRTFITKSYFMQKLFKEEQPKLADKYTEDRQESRITFELR